MDRVLVLRVLSEWMEIIYFLYSFSPESNKDMWKGFNTTCAGGDGFFSQAKKYVFCVL